MRLEFFYLCAIFVALESSKCPEPKKPHPTSCTIFYNCVNLPDGGYVWIPSRCTQGLVFQPYLRICVLPGDSWTCDTLSIESTIVTKKYEKPELIDPLETSYVGFEEEDSKFSEVLDSSYTTDDISDDTSNQETVTPYPLIEIDENLESTCEKSTISDQTVSEENYGQKQNDKIQSINRFVIYKEITFPLDFLSTISLPAHVITNRPESSKNPESNKNSGSNLLMNYLIQNYIQQNNLQNNILLGVEHKNAMKTHDNVKVNLSADPTPPRKQSIENVSELSITDTEAASNIVSVKDYLGNTQYLTIQKYKSLVHRLKPDSIVGLMLCVKNIRLPNATNCARYYTCDPQTAVVNEWFCPSNTAFNEYTRVCDIDSQKACKGADKSKIKDTVLASATETKVSDENLCKELGKTKDPNSNSHYYICYSASSTDATQNIKSARRSCPNNLIFCQSIKLCTTQLRCKEA